MFTKKMPTLFIEGTRNKPLTTGDIREAVRNTWLDDIDFYKKRGNRYLFCHFPVIV
jgi:hypothetical protein